MKNKKKSIRWKLLSINLLPTIVLGIAISIIGIYLIYSFSENNIHNELMSTTHLLKGCFDLTVRGDYTFDGDSFKKGAIDISDSTMLFDIKSNSNIDTTIFWGDTRVMTTVENQYGASAVGTKAAEDVIQTVLVQGENYYSKNLLVDGQEYIGYYTPLRNSDQTIIGMVFAGRQVRTVYENIRDTMLYFLLFSILALVLATIMSGRFSRGMIKDIGLIEKYLHTIADGDFTASMDERLLGRDDEIGEIGIYANKMCNDLKSLVELDSLTTLYNRRSCNNQIKALMKEDSAFTVVMCDVDYFKRINDQYGHDCGDYVLTTISGMMKTSVEDCGFASRWGGEEFLLVYKLEFSEAKKKVEELADKIREFDFTYKDQQMSITLTFGMKKKEQGMPYEEIINAADNKLYLGKRNGRNQIVC